ncbi:MAG: type II secretion system protein GspC [Gammaproteobacteria bacterium]
MAISLSQDSEQVTAALRRLPRLACLVLIVLIAYVLADLTWRIVAAVQGERAQARPPRVTNVATANTSQVDYGAQVAALHLYGTQVKTVEQKAETAPETRANLKLRGVFATGDHTGIAIIAGSGPERFYRIGDSIDGGRVLNAVYEDRVLLELNTKLETLRLPKAEETGFSTGAPPPPAPVASPAGDAVNTSQNLARLRQQILKDPNQLARMVEAKPVMDNGEFKGYELAPRRNKRLFQQLGLEPGDVVTGVNGISLDRPENGLTALQSLVDAAEITVTVQRAGSEVTLQHTIN